MSPRSGLPVRIALASAGVLASGLSLLSDAAGMSDPGGLGEGQLLAMVFGTLMILAAVLWRSFPPFWRMLGRLILLALCLYAVRGAAGAFARAVTGPASTAADGPVLGPGFVPSSAVDLRYAPHVMWTAAGPDRGPGGPGSPGTDGLVRIYGSSGDGSAGLDRAVLDTLRISPGSETLLDRRQPRYNSTQSLILLMCDLRDCPPPATVVLTAGIDDVSAAYANRDPVWPAGSQAFRLAAGSRCDLSADLGGGTLAAAVASAQEVNRRVLGAIGDEYGFETRFVWLGCPEEAILDGPEDFAALCRQVDSLVAEGFITPDSVPEGRPTGR